MPETQALIALGANLGDAETSLKLALDLLESHHHLSLQSASSFFITLPVGGPTGQPRFINAAASLKTRLTADELLSVLHQIEADLGRVRNLTWAARSLDLDILSFGNMICNTNRLTLPHPRMTVRRFVIEPLAEIEPMWIHPQLGWSVKQILEHLKIAPRSVNIGKVFESVWKCTSARDLLSRFPEVTDGWEWQTETADSMFEVDWLDGLMADNCWQLPRFHPTRDEPENLMDQLIATCRGMTITG